MRKANTDEVKGLLPAPCNVYSSTVEMHELGSDLTGAGIPRDKTTGVQLHRVQNEGKAIVKRLAQVEPQKGLC